MGDGENMAGAKEIMIDINFDFQAEADVDKNGVQHDSDKYSPDY